ncbi:MAG: Ig-like domain-containing protein, partial [bacterium]|nr:Ig-like domain-containing protein [bacterium]
TETSPRADATGVAQTVTITVTFNEPLRQFGDFISVSGSLNPPPTSGDLGRQLELVNDGKTLQFQNVELADNTDYTLSIDAATSRAGNILSQPVLLQFSTGTTLTQLGSLDGSVSLSGGEQFVGTVRLFNEQGEALISVPLDAEGRFSLTAVFEGTYRLSAEVQAEDGRTLSAFLDDDDNGIPDDVTLSAGQNLSNLAFVLSLPELAQPGASGVNKDASVVLDLDIRSGNQSLDNLKALPDSEVRVAVYAKDVVNLIGFSVSFSYDTTAVSFQGIDENTTSENNLLRKNAGLAVTLPPTVRGGNVEYNGAILGATEQTVVSGDGLLGIFRFKTKRNFSDKTEFLIPRVRLESSGQTDNLSVLARATLEQATIRILMTLTAEPETIPANGTTTIQVDLKDVAGSTVTEDTQIRFAVTAGNATLEPSEVTASNGTAQIQLIGGGTAGTVTISVTAEGSTEQISLVLTETTDGTGTPSEGIDLPSGPRGPIALDLNTDTGDQGKTQTTTAPRSGNQIAIDIVAVSGASGNIGFQVILTYDETQLQFDGFDTKDLWLAGVPIVPPASGGEAQIQVALLGQTTSKDAGSMGHAKFTVLSGFTGTTKVEIKSASFDTPVEVGTGGIFVVIGSASGSVVPEDPIEASDIDGDGQVGFSDFLSFAQGFGRDSTNSDFNPRLDLDGDGNIGFSDFIKFAQNFGKSVGG